MGSRLRGNDPEKMASAQSNHEFLARLSGRGRLRSGASTQACRSPGEAQRNPGFGIVRSRISLRSYGYALLLSYHHGPVIPARPRLRPRDGLAAGQTHVRGMAGRRAPLSERLSLARMAHRHIFRSRTLRRTLSKARMVETLASSHIIRMVLRQLLHKNATRSRSLCFCRSKRQRQYEGRRGPGHSPSRSHWHCPLRQKEHFGIASVKST